MIGNLLGLCEPEGHEYIFDSLYKCFSNLLIVIEFVNDRYGVLHVKKNLI